MPPIKAGVVGVGHMGQYHVGVYSELYQLELVGIADINKTRADEIAQRYNTTPYYHAYDLIDKVEVVSIAVPTPKHYQVAKDFLEAGIPVLLEKPITQNLAQAKELFQIADRHGTILHIGHVERFNGAVQELKRLVNQPIFLESRRLGPYTPRIADEGVILDLMIHDLDIVLNVVNSRVKKITVVGYSLYSKYEDLANVQIAFENGCLASITASRTTQQKIRTLAVTQRDTYIFLNYTDQDIHIHRNASSEHILTRKELRYKQESFVERIFVHKDNPLKLEIIHLLDCITNGVVRNTSIEGELYSLEIALKIIDMMKEEKVIPKDCYNEY
jgi:predicted dehydrogenase